MTPIILVDKLIEFLQPVVAQFELQSNVPGIKKAPQVIAGYLEEKRPREQQDPPDFPFVIVRFLEDNDTGNGNTAIVKIIAGTYSEDLRNGWRDCMNVITRIKEALLEQRFIGGPFKVEYPMKIELPEEQPYPEWAAFLTLNVTIPSVQEEGGYLKDVFS
ncbi:MAG: hypothetical protein IMW94_10545 [Thermoanaerobacter sp.]|nr:hypothetical protein [Thermoanaerobacter sp.]